MILFDIASLELLVSYFYIISLARLQAGTVPHDKVGNISKTNCWICEGWQEYWFEFTPGISTNEPINLESPLYLNWEVDEYKEDMLLHDSGRSGTFVSYRMLPPTKQNYYFTSEEKVLTAFDQESEEWKIFNEENWISFANVIKDLRQQTWLYTKDILSRLNCIPRPAPKSLEKRERIKTPWDFFKSVFKGRPFVNKF